MHAIKRSINYRHSLNIANRSFVLCAEQKIGKSMYVLLMVAPPSFGVSIKWLSVCGKKMLNENAVFHFFSFVKSSTEWNHFHSEIYMLLNFLFLFIGICSAIIWTSPRYQVCCCFFRGAPSSATYLQSLSTSINSTVRGFLRKAIFGSYSIQRHLFLLDITIASWEF